MKKKFLLLLPALVFAVSAMAQRSYSCYYREYCNWNSTSEKFENCSGESEPSLFEMNEQETMFTHTISSMKSTYYVKSRSWNAASGLWLYTVKSDVGNSYVYVFDEKNKEIRVLITSGDDIRMVRFYIKSAF